MSKCFNSPNFLWKIKNYSSIDKIVCPAVLIGGLKWQLSFSHYMESGVEKIRLVLESLNAFETSSALEFDVEVHYALDDGRSWLVKTSKYDLKDKELCAYLDSVKTVRQSFSQSDDVTFLVIVRPSGKPEDTFKCQENFNEVDGESLCIRSLTEDFRRLFNNEDNYDFVLECADKKFHVHKAILTSRSEYFAGMFRSNMEEVQKNSGKINNLEPDILELVLVYIYTGKIPKLSIDSLKKVYAAADRLAVDPLKIKCHSLFLDHFTTGVANVSVEKTEDQVSPVSDPAEVLEPKSDTDHFLPSKEEKLLKDLFMTREWRLFSQEFPHMSVEMCRPYLLRK